MELLNENKLKDGASFNVGKEDAGASPVAQLVKNLPAVQETWV